MPNEMTTPSMANQSGSHEWIDRLFARLGLMYGQMWTDRWRDAPMDLVKGEWARALEKFDFQTIRKALDWCAEHQKYPPMLPEFVEACRNSKPAAGAFRRLESKGPKVPIPPEVKAQLDAFVAKHRA